MRKLLVGLVALLMLVVAGCSPAESPSPDQPSGSTPGTPGQTTAATTPQTDPRTLSGPTTVEVTQTIKPVATSPQQHLPATFRDATGKDVTITDASRVLVLDIYGTYTQIVMGLGLQHILVGRTSSDTQPELQDLPLVTRDGHALNAEAILSLSPTLVVTDTTLGPPEVMEQLRASGITVVTLSPDRSLETVGSSIHDIATILGVPEIGEELAAVVEADIEAASTEVAAMAPAEPMRGMVLYIRGTAGVFFILGKGYGTDALLQAIGAEDTASTRGVADVQPANAEALARLDPEFILVMTRGLESTGGIPGLLERPGVAQTTAGARQRIIDIDDNQLLSFGPNTGAVIRALAKAVYQP